MERTTIRLPDELLEQAKARARQTGRTFTQLVEQAVRSELAHPGGAYVAERGPGYAVRTNDSNGNSSEVEEAQTTRAQHERSTNQLIEQVKELQAFLNALPDLDSRSAEEILGYNDFGVPD